MMATLFLDARIRRNVGPGSGRIWMSEVMCSGTESSLFNCDQAPLGVNSCSHGQDVVIRCRNQE